FPPHSLSQEDYYHGRVEALHNIIDYIRNSAANYVVMMDCDHVCNLDVEEIINYHIATKADVTVVCRTRLDGNDTTSDSVAVKCDEHGRVKELLFDAFEKDCVESMNVFIVARDKLVNLIEQAQSRRKIYFERDVLLSQLGKLHVQSYMFKGFCRRVFDTKSYFSANMALLDPCNMHALFVPERPVYTKVRDDAPVRYGLNAKVKNSLIADGCVVLGDVENCLLFRGVTVGEDAVLRNSIVMQDTIIGENSDLSYIITDKNVTVGASRSLMGHENYPLYIKKLSNI
ncbi:MAG: glucose-1-phosphate adenylyltransferase subunit GlgD, partial [Oscillospiraceae bacterium]